MVSLTGQPLRDTPDRLLPDCPTSTFDFPLISFIPSNLKNFQLIPAVIHFIFVIQTQTDNLIVLFEYWFGWTCNTQYHSPVSSLVLLHWSSNYVKSTEMNSINCISPINRVLN